MTASRLADLQERAELVKDRLAPSDVIGRKVVLKKQGREFAGLCPFHAEKSPSFYVNDRKRFFHCFGCGAHGDVIAFVRRMQGVGFVDALQLLESEAGLERFARAAPAARIELSEAARARREARERESRDERLRKRATAQQIWDARQPVTSGGPVDRYLRGRLLVPPADYGCADAAVNAGWPADLGFVPALWHPYMKQAWPAMLAAIRGPGGALWAVHQTFLVQADRGLWLKASLPVKNWSKLVLGGYTADTDSERKTGGCIWLATPAPSMIGGEGIETSLSAMQIWRRPGLCFVSAGNMPNVELPVGCAFFTYAADKDLKRQGERRAWLAARAQAFGRRVEVVVPRLPDPKCDFNDVLQRRAPARQGRAA